jgi:ABC-type transport system involved in cytochrome c biogenesis permease component
MSDAHSHEYDVTHTLVFFLLVVILFSLTVDQDLRHEVSPLHLIPQL